MVPVLVRRRCLAECVMLSWGNASAVVFCVSVLLLNKILPGNVSLVYSFDYAFMQTSY